MVQYTGMVERIARRFAGIEPHADLVQVGFIGLLNALSKFDPEAGVRFNTYATHLVTGEIKHYLRDRSQTIRQPAWLQELRHKVNRASGTLQQSNGAPPTAAQIAAEIGVTESAVQEVINTQEMLKVQSLDATRSNDEDGPTDLDLLDAGDFCPEQLSVEDRVVLESAMAQLRDLERQVIIFFHFDSLSQTEIAKRLGISCNYVSHILRQSLAKLRKILVEEETKDRLLRAESASIDFEIVDPDTGVYTEAFLKNRLEEELHRSSNEAGGVALLLVEFRGLAEMRRFYGDEAVSTFLTDAAEFLKSNVRRLDIVAHRGDSGFGVILPFAGSNVCIVRNRVQARMEQWVPTKSSAFSRMSVRFGEAFAPDAGRSAASLIAQASKPAEEPVI